MTKIILEIRAGTGGEEAATFAADLARMYERYAQRQGWKTILIEASENSLGGYRTFIAEFAGEGVYETLKQESGVHRVQRIPATEKAGRVHTSTASVAVLPEAASNEIQVHQNDLDISFFRSSGPGGQNVNKVETAVRILHKPTGIVVSSQVERSQSRNRDLALEVLRAKLYEQKRIEEQQKLGKLRSDLIGSNERAEKVRTYNFPQDRITDHRIGKKWHHLEAILDGNLDPIVEAFKKMNGS